MEYAQLQNNQSKLHYHHTHTKLSNKFLLIHSDQDIVYKKHPLF